MSNISNSAQTMETTLSPYPELDRELTKLAANRDKWVATPIAERIAILAEIKECLMPVAQAWAETAARKKGIADGSPLTGEEWTSGPVEAVPDGPE